MIYVVNCNRKLIFSTTQVGAPCLVVIPLVCPFTLYSHTGCHFYTHQSTNNAKVGHAIKLVIFAMIFRHVALCMFTAIHRLSVQHTKGVHKGASGKHNLHFQLSCML